MRLVQLGTLQFLDRVHLRDAMHCRDNYPAPSLDILTPLGITCTECSFSPYRHLGHHHSLPLHVNRNLLPMSGQTGTSGGLLDSLSIEVHHTISGVGSLLSCSGIINQTYRCVA